MTIINFFFDLLFFFKPLLYKDLNKIYVNIFKIMTILKDFKDFYPILEKFKSFKKLALSTTGLGKYFA